MNVFVYHKTRTIHLDNVVAIIFQKNCQFIFSGQAFAVASTWTRISRREDQGRPRLNVALFKLPLQERKQYRKYNHPDARGQPWILTFGETSEISAYKVSIAESGMKNLPERFVVKSPIRARH